MQKEYIGDGVYIECDHYGSVILSTSDGISTTNYIVLEPEVLDAFDSFVGRMRMQRRHAL